MIASTYLDVKNLTNNNCYDVIVSWAVLEHIIDPKKAIKSMYSFSLIGWNMFS